MSYVADGDSLCVALGASTDRWVEVRLEDFYAPELHASGGTQAKAALERITRGKTIACVVDHRSYDRVVARCVLGGRSVGDMMRAAGIKEGGNR